MALDPKDISGLKQINLVLKPGWQIEYSFSQDVSPEDIVEAENLTGCKLRQKGKWKRKYIVSKNKSEKGN